MADPNPLPVLDEAERSPLVEVLPARIEQLLEEQQFPPKKLPSL
jgi:hypothetical protein